MSDLEPSIFYKYFNNTPLEDRFAVDPTEAVDVIIPIIHTNELWRNNLLSIYREVPVNRLLIGDGGCIDDSVKIAMEFPRVKVLNHRNFKSLGYSIKGLIEEVQTEWFIYAHSDVSLPSGWFNTMKKYKGQYDWFGCPQRLTVLVEYPLIDKIRPYAGTQMGRKIAFEKGLSKIDDDYVYRQEDFVFVDVISKAGYKEGRIEDTFHYHQVMHKQSPWGSKVKNVAIDLNLSPEEELRARMTQAKGIVKYLEPDEFQISAVIANVNRLEALGKMTWKEFLAWVKETNPVWLKHFTWSKRTLFRQRLKEFAKAGYNLFFWKP